MMAEYEAGGEGGAGETVKGVEGWVASNQQDGAAVGSVAQAKLISGKQDGAIQLDEQGLDGNPEDVAMLNNLAVLYHQNCKITKRTWRYW